MVTYSQLIKSIKEIKPHSAWEKGVKAYALEFFEYPSDKGIKLSDKVPEPRILEDILLNGAKDWKHYSWGGCSLVYDIDIAKTLCSPSELKKALKMDKYGITTLRKPNPSEEWLDTQARALFQAFELIKRTYLALKGQSGKY